MTTTIALTGAAETAHKMEREPIILRKRIGSTTFIISVATCPTATEPAEKKILRLIEREVQNV